MEGAGAPVTVLGAQGVEEGMQQEEGLSLEGVRGLGACVEGVAEGNCCNLEAGKSGASWVVGRWKEEEGQEAELLVVDRHGGDMVVLAARNWAAWGRRRDPQSSSTTADSGSPPRTYRSWWWT